MRSQRKVEYQRLLQMVNEQKANDLPFVVYRSPEKNTLKAIFQKDAVLHKVKDFTETGFIFAPFDTLSPPILMTSDEVLFTESIPNSKNVTTGVGLQHDQSKKEEYLDLVKKAIGKIKENEFDKVVVSRQMHVKKHIDPWLVFERAIVTYPTAFCYLWYHPKVGLWLGATPELLVAQNQFQISTSALAGTVAVTDANPPNWENKELNEQQFVTDYIKSILGNLVDELMVSDTATIKAGGLWHLKTTLSGRLTSSSGLQDIILQLHPTPAVCGTPRETAKDFILAHEAYSRSFYTGYLGEVQVSGPDQASLYVNLRCMQLEGDSIKIYVGGGITAESNPEQEYIETQNKSRTMGNLL